MSRTTLLRSLTLLVCCVLLWPAGRADAQGVTTGAMTGVVKDAQGAVIPGATVIAVHQPSGSTYEAVTQADGRFSFPACASAVRTRSPRRSPASRRRRRTTSREPGRHAGPRLHAEGRQRRRKRSPSSGRAIRCSARAAPAPPRPSCARISRRCRRFRGRITDITRLTPQYGGSGTFAGQDNRANNMTVDGSYFNNSFGLGVATGGIGDRTGVAPISLEAIEQVQVSVAPYDVRQGSFIGAGVNTVTRSGTNQFTASRTTGPATRTADVTNVDTFGFVGTDAAGLTLQPGHLQDHDHRRLGRRPDRQEQAVRVRQLREAGRHAPADDVHVESRRRAGRRATRRACWRRTSPRSARSCRSKFNYDTGPFDNITKITPGQAVAAQGRLQHQQRQQGHVPLQPARLEQPDVAQNGSSRARHRRPADRHRRTSSASQNSNYAILENIKSGIGEWNSVFGNDDEQPAHRLHEAGREPRPDSRSSSRSSSSATAPAAAYTSFGSEPFTPYNLLRYNTFQLQDSVTKFAKNHSLTFGGTVEKFHSDNSFYFGIQSAYVYNSLADFYADANGFLANPNRTVSPVTLRSFQVKYLLQPGQTTPPLQPLDVVYAGGYVQDEWRPRSNLTVTAGLRVDVPKFGNTAFDNPVADALTFRDQDGSPVQYNTGALPETTPLLVAARRLQLGRDRRSDDAGPRRHGPLHGQAAVRLDLEPDRQHRRAVRVHRQPSNTTAFPFNPNPDKYKPAATGGAAASYELDVTDQSFRFPQTWRTNIGVDRRLPWGLVGTLDYIYNRDVNAPVYINANLPAAAGRPTPASTTGRAGSRRRPAPRWRRASPSRCRRARRPARSARASTRLNNAAGNQVTAAYVIKNQSQNRSWNISGALTKNMTHGFSFKGGYSYGVSRSLVEPSSTAGSSWGSAQSDRRTIRTTRRWRTRPTRPASACSSRRTTPRSTSAWARRRSRRSTTATPTATPATSSPATRTATA